MNFIEVVEFQNYFYETFAKRVWEFIYFVSESNFCSLPFA